MACPGCAFAPPKRASHQARFLRARVAALCISLLRGWSSSDRVRLAAPRTFNPKCVAPRWHPWPPFRAGLRLGLKPCHAASAGQGELAQGAARTHAQSPGAACGEDGEHGEHGPLNQGERGGPPFPNGACCAPADRLADLSEPLLCPARKRAGLLGRLVQGGPQLASTVLDLCQMLAGSCWNGSNGPRRARCWARVVLHTPCSCMHLKKGRAGTARPFFLTETPFRFRAPWMVHLRARARIYILFKYAVSDTGLFSLEKSLCHSAFSHERYTVSTG